MSSRLAASLARRGLHYGWVIAGVTFLTMLVTAGTVGAPGVLMLPLEREFGWETADMGRAEAARAIEPLCMLWCIPNFLKNERNHAFKLLR